MKLDPKRLIALRVADPIAWAGHVTNAMKIEGHNVRRAAIALGVSWRTLMRWLAMPELRAVPRSRPRKASPELVEVVWDATSKTSRTLP